MALNEMGSIPSISREGRELLTESPGELLLFSGDSTELDRPNRLTWYKAASCIAF